jgi:antirestriction protein
MEAQIYVGTYGKYNEGSLFGEWIDITQYADKEDFYEGCKELHKNEYDPEYMFQDFDGILSEMPKKWLSESHISEEVFEFLAHFSEDGSKGEAFLNWVSSAGYTGDFQYLLSKFEDAYYGEYDSPKDFAEYLVEDTGVLDKMGELSQYFDYEDYARDLFMTDFMYLDGVVYRNL